MKIKRRTSGHNPGHPLEWLFQGYGEAADKRKNDPYFALFWSVLVRQEQIVHKFIAGA